MQTGVIKEGKFPIVVIVAKNEEKSVS